MLLFLFNLSGRVHSSRSCLDPKWEEGRRGRTGTHAFKSLHLGGPVTWCHHLHLKPNSLQSPVMLSATGNGLWCISNSPCLYWFRVWKPQGTLAGCAAFLRRLLSCVLRVSEIEFAVIVVAVDRLIVCGICWKVQRPLHRPLADTFIYNFLGGWWMDRIQESKLFRLVFHGMHLLSRTTRNVKPHAHKKRKQCVDSQSPLLCI